MENQTTCIKIIESVIVDQKYLVVAHLLAGEVECDSILISQDTGIKFIIKGIGFIPHEAHAKGRRAITVIPYDDNLKCDLKIGEVLCCLS